MKIRYNFMNGFRFIAFIKGFTASIFQGSPASVTVF